MPRIQKAPRKVLVIDVGGTHVKLCATGHTQRIKIDSGTEMTPELMVAAIKERTSRWKYEAVSIGYPGPVAKGRPAAEPHNLAPGWVGFNFEKALGVPVKIINDAAMQALGSYRGGRMLFLGLGTGLGSALVLDGVLAPMELAHLPYKKGRSFEEYVGAAGLKRAGKKRWCHHVGKVVDMLKRGLQADYVVLGGGNSRLIEKLPANTRLGDNNNAFRGGFLLWAGKQA